MGIFLRFLSGLIIPIGLFNMFGGIVSGIWLAILGEWNLIGYGILALLVSGVGLSFVMAPGLIFLTGPAVILLEKGHKISGSIFGLLSAFYTNGILTAWCILVLFYFINHTNADSIIPGFIWSYGIATSPIAWLAQKDQQSGNKYSMITTFFISLAYILTILAILLAGASLMNILILFGVIMSISLIVEFSIAYLADKSREYY